VVVTDLDVKRISVAEPEADPPLVIDRYGVLTKPVPLERVQPVAGRQAQLLEFDGGIDVVELAPGPSLDVWRQPPRPPAKEESLSVLVGERPDQGAV
jgi:hypothetical protein